MAIINGKNFDVILDHSFQVIFNKIDHWISAKSDWVNESVDGDYSQEVLTFNYLKI